MPVHQVSSQVAQLIFHLEYLTSACNEHSSSMLICTFRSIPAAPRKFHQFIRSTFRAKHVKTVVEEKLEALPWWKALRQALNIVVSLSENVARACTETRIANICKLAALGYHNTRSSPGHLAYIAPESNNLSMPLKNGTLVKASIMRIVRTSKKICSHATLTDTMKLLAIQK